MRTIFSFSLILLVVGLIATSCGNRDKIVYFQGEQPIADSSAYYFSPTFEVNDLLSVEVSGTDPEVAAPYNQAEVWRQGGNQITSYENGVPATYGYLVDSDSSISLPIIGKVKIAGMQRDVAKDTIEARLSNYLEKPQVSIRLLNFKITVLGDVKNPGTFSIPNERITILEAIGIAKDLNITGNRKNILIVRTEGGKKKEFRIDITSKEVFTSPVYYLKQNDVVYVEPNNKARFDSSILRTTSGLIISVASLIISTMILITRF